MKPFSVTLTHAQANLIFNALQTHVSNTQEKANEIIQYLDAEFKKANTPEAPKVEEAVKTEEQPANG